jgi:hypothetical protein
MTLPELPKIRKKKEADITPHVLLWFKKNYPRSAAIEIKYGKNKLEEHQVTALAQVAKGSFTYKIPDMGRMNPFDGFLLKDADACLVTCEGRTCLVEVNKTHTFSIKV